MGRCDKGEPTVSTRRPDIGYFRTATMTGSRYANKTVLGSHINLFLTDGTYATAVAWTARARLAQLSY